MLDRFRRRRRLDLLLFREATREERESGACEAGSSRPRSSPEESATGHHPRWVAGECCNVLGGTQFGDCGPSERSRAMVAIQIPKNPPYAFLSEAHIGPFRPEPPKRPARRATPVGQHARKVGPGAEKGGKRQPHRSLRKQGFGREAASAQPHAGPARGASTVLFNKKKKET